MAVKSIIDIDLRGDEKFKGFARLYQQYEKSLKRMPEAWRLVNQKIDGSRSSFDKLVASMAAATVQDRLRAKAQERADQMTRTTADRWRDISRHTRSAAGNIKDATIQLLKWGSITSVVSGLLGAGGIWGIDRLALSAASQRRSSFGLGTSIGGQNAFGNFSRLVDPDSFLGNVAGAKGDITRRVGLISAGLSPGEINGDTSQTAVALLRRLKTLSDNTDPGLYAQALQARRLDQFAGPEDLRRLHATSPQEFSQLISQFNERQKSLDLPADVAKKWQDFTTQMNNAGTAIENTFVRALVPLEPGLQRLSVAFEKTVSNLVSHPALKEWLDKVDTGLEKFAGYIGTPEFQKNVEDFVSGLSRLGSAVGNFANWFTSRFGDGGAPSSAGPSAHIKNRLAQANKRRIDRGEYVPNPVGTWLGNLAVSNTDIDKVLPLIRQAERSGDNSISPKGARGRYQIMPKTAEQYGYDPAKLSDPAYNERVARVVVGDLIRRYHGNTAEVLAAYNAGPGRVDRILSGKENSLPRETQKYGNFGLTVTIDNNTGGNTITSVNGLKN